VIRAPRHSDSVSEMFHELKIFKPPMALLAAMDAAM
jgi:hypothetical protein